MTTLRFPKPVDLAAAALFLDFDGTLAPIAPRPELVSVADSTLAALTRLHDALDGAVAVISGRDIDAIDRMLAPLKLAVAGSHGAERRDASGHLHRAEDDQDALEIAAAGLSQTARPHGLLVERKRGAVSLHFRSHPELEDECRARAAAIAAETPALRAIQGHMVAELALQGRDKGQAVEAFLTEAPFRGRLPIAFGDDMTDEDAFVAAQRHGGLGVKIGSGESAAEARAADIDEFLGWLSCAAERL